MESCKHLDASICLLASSLGNVSVPTTAAACAACSNDAKPRQVNVVVCSIAYAATKDPRILKQHQLLGLVGKPGSAIRMVLADIGIRESVDCDCSDYAEMMDGWGWQGCVDRKEVIIRHLNLQSITWFDMVKVAASGFFTTRSIVEHALEISKTS